MDLPVSVRSGTLQASAFYRTDIQLLE